MNPTPVDERVAGREADKCRELLQMLDGLQKNNFGKVVTGDENWFYLETGHSAQWSVCRDDVTTKTKPTIGTSKLMLMVMWGMKNFHVVNLMTSQNQFNSQYFVEHIMIPFLQEIFPHGRNRRALRLLFIWTTLGPRHTNPLQAHRICHTAFQIASDRLSRRLHSEQNAAIPEGQRTRRSLQSD
jgi:hypothetical protein